MRTQRVKKINKIAGAQEICEFWTELLRGEETELKDKLKVSEFLAKASGAFSFEPGAEAAQGEFEALSLGEKLGIIESIKNEGK